MLVSIRRRRAEGATPATTAPDYNAMPWRELQAAAKAAGLSLHRKGRADLVKELQGSGQ